MNPALSMGSQYSNAEPEVMRPPGGLLVEKGRCSPVGSTAIA
jgi:hypothetical protein